MNKQSLMPRVAVVLAALGAVIAGTVLSAHAVTPQPQAHAVSTVAQAQGELFPELNGLRIKAVNTGDVYLVLDGKRHLIPSTVTYNALFRTTDGVRLVLTTANITDGGPLTAYAYLARSIDDTTVYLVSNGSKREITPAALDKFGFNTAAVRTTYPSVLAALPTAAPLT
ncbi:MULTISPECIES: hypothetical protein [Streptomyces]|uniref:Secreted protein n=1 Tax=Streptomyces viridochromogenes TaxID=1938 RepID=A0A0L8JG46_STRVR|nr:MULTISPECIES: hypothetical protein [Streptomyces]KOG12611.1 hypothetical protein ADK34_31545 [Streptomyces viridochromogenes]